MQLTINKKINREDKKYIKRQKIVDSASMLFSQTNYHEVMIEDVAKNANIAKGTVYNYFNSKEELYFYLIEQKLSALTNSLIEKIKRENNRINSLHIFVIHNYMFMMKYNNFFLIYQKESFNKQNEFCKEINLLENLLKQLLNDIISKGQEDGVFRKTDTKLTTELILGSLYAAVNKGIKKGYSKEQQKTEREKIFNFVLQSLVAGNNISETLPLLGRTIVITRTVEQSKESEQAFIKLGADIIIFPTLDIVPPESWKAFDEIVKSEEKINFIIFTSKHAVEMFVKRCLELKIKFDYKNVKVVAVGNKTAFTCKEINIPVSIIPKIFSGKGVVAELSKFDIEKKVVFIPRSAIGREELPHGLSERGAIIKTANVYNVTLPNKNIVGENIRRLKDTKPDMFIFTSPSTFKNFLKLLDITNPVQFFSPFDVASIGPTTKATIESRKVKVDVMPDDFTINGLIKAIIYYYKLR
jgi:uroporphyrinogen-III synthase